MLDGVAYDWPDTVFPNGGSGRPLTGWRPEEEEVMQRLERAFTGCESCSATCASSWMRAACTRFATAACCSTCVR